MWELVLAIFGIVAGAAIGKAQMDEQASRTAHETKIRNIFTAVKNKFGVTIDQLNQLSEKMGINLERLTNAARGSARLSDASRLYREYIEQYPDKIAKINKLKNSINNEINVLSRYEETLSAKAQTGGTTSNYDIGQLTQKSIENVNQGINEINTSLSDGSTSDNKISNIEETKTPESVVALSETK